ncbi:MAG TPA: phage holin family protein [Pseudonocardiaceae bacterium]|nr:phage holin family protein [Pseudonocardiaceae bacterium]
MATRRTSDIAGDMAENLSRLIREELRLAGDELRAKATRAGTGGTLLAVAGVLALYAGACVLAGLAALLGRVLPRWLAAVVVGGALGTAAGVIGAAGVAEVRRGLPLAPESAATSLAAAADAGQSD